MARDIIDLRRKETDLGMNLKAVADLLTTLGQAEAQRQQRAQTEQLLDLLGQGKDISQIGTELLGAPRAEFSPGISGIAQRIGSPFAAKPNVAEILANLSLKQRLDEPTGQAKQLLTERIRNAKAMADLREAELAAGPQTPGITKEGQRKLDSQNILTLNRKTSTSRQIESAIDALNKSPQIVDIFTRNTVIKDITGAFSEADDIFSGAVEKFEPKRETIKGKFFKDDRNGEAVYKSALQTILRQTVSEGFNPASVVVAFNRWWDEQFEKKKGKDFQEFVDRATFNIDTSDLPEEASVAIAPTVIPQREQNESIADFIRRTGL